MNLEINLKGPWFSPRRVISNFGELSQCLSSKQKTSRGFKKASEANIVAITLLGLIKKTGMPYWLQTIDDSKGSPDIRTCWTKVPLDSINSTIGNVPFNVHDFEVVTLETHSRSEDIADFIYRTKLSPSKKKYTNYTSILCSIETDKYIPPFEVIKTKLSMMDVSQNDVMIVGQVGTEDPIFRLCKVYPSLIRYEDFNVREEFISSSPKIQILFTNRAKKEGKPRLELGSNIKLTPFDNLEFD